MINAAHQINPTGGEARLSKSHYEIIGNDSGENSVAYITRPNEVKKVYPSLKRSRDRGVTSLRTM